MTRKYVPEGQTPITPYLLTDDADGLISFLKSALSAEERRRILGPENSIQHAELTIDGATVFVGTRDRRAENSTHLYVHDVDSTYTRCLLHGATSLSEPRTYAYGDRAAGIRDPYGNLWWLGTHL